MASFKFRQSGWVAQSHFSAEAASCLKEKRRCFNNETVDEREKERGKDATGLDRERMRRDNGVPGST